MNHEGHEDFKKIAAILLLSWCALLSGCAQPNVKYEELRPATTATVSGSTVVIHLGSDLQNSACWTIPKVRVAGRTVVYVSGYRSMHEQSREFAIQLPPAEGSQQVKVVWVDPDGSRIAVPVLPKKI
jgi:hypothetical protein